MGHRQELTPDSWLGLPCGKSRSIARPEEGVCTPTEALCRALDLPDPAELAFGIQVHFLQPRAGA